MKRILLIIAITLVSVASASAINLQEAFSALSNLPNVTVKENMDLKDLTNNKCPIKLDSLKIAQVAIGYDLDAEKNRYYGKRRIRYSQSDTFPIYDKRREQQ